MQKLGISSFGRGQSVSQAVDNRKRFLYLPFRPSSGIFIYLGRVFGKVKL
jgi:hypothetical protein